MRAFIGSYLCHRVCVHGFEVISSISGDRGKLRCLVRQLIAIADRLYAQRDNRKLLRLSMTKQSMSKSGNQ
jgi:hypothetical protein